MKKALFLPILALLLITACEKEQSITTETQPAKAETNQDLTSVPTPPAGVTVEDRSSKKVTICHKTGNGQYNPIQVNQNAVAAHLAHGDYLPDADGDGYTAGGACVGSQNDCNDNNPSINPAAIEVCDGIDNNCNGQTDEGVQTTFYADGDGYGNAAISQQACSAPGGYVLDNTDCNDGEASAYPGAEEVCGDEIDNDCDAVADEDCGAGLLLVTLPDGSYMYIHPTDNSTGILWGGAETDIPGLVNRITLADANADFAGAANTQIIVTALGGGTYAAKLCADLVAYGYDDWYLPAAGELNTIYQQLGPNGSNNIPYGWYWSSSEHSATGAWGRNFANGSWHEVNKANYDYCRCVRR
jgi:hypothetical protein